MFFETEKIHMKRNYRSIGTYLINALTSTYLIWITVSLKFKVHVEPNEWYSYLTEKRTSTVTLLINPIISITLMGIIKNLHKFVFFLLYIFPNFRN